MEPIEEFEKIVLRRLEFCMEQALSPELVTSAKVQITQDYLIPMMRVKLQAFVWAEDESVTYQEVWMPLDWWEAFKDRWFPKWLKKLYPVRCDVTRLDVKAIYPNFRAKLPDQEVRLVIIKDTRREEDNS